MNDRAFTSNLDHTSKAADVDPAQHAAIFYIGGHGVMWDFPGNAALQQAAREIYENGGVVSSVCHDACGLLNITSDGTERRSSHCENAGEGPLAGTAEPAARSRTGTRESACTTVCCRPVPSQRPRVGSTCRRFLRQRRNPTSSGCIKKV